MRRLVGLLCLALAAASCTNTNAVHLIAAKQLAPDLYGKPQQQVSARTQQVIVYFIRGNRLVQQTRTGSSSLTLPQLAMRQLLEGPSAEEQADGLSTAVPKDTALLSVAVDNHQVATVNLSQEFQQAAEQKLQQFRLAQVVFTLTELSDVDSVRFSIEGDPTNVIDQNGVAVLGAVSRARFSRYQSQEGLTTPVDPCTLVESLGSCPGASTTTSP
jgi:spore germination protein GerM